VSNGTPAEEESPSAKKVWLANTRGLVFTDVRFLFCSWWVWWITQMKILRRERRMKTRHLLPPRQRLRQPKGSGCPRSATACALSLPVLH
jgi:hypothetical protein